MIKLYVGNLPYSFKDDTLKDLFSPYGEVISSVIITDRASGRSKGFGFVELNDEEGKQAIAELNEKEVEGRKLVVNEARPREERPRRNFNNNNNRW